MHNPIFYHDYNVINIYTLKENVMTHKVSNSNLYTSPLMSVYGIITLFRVYVSFCNLLNPETILGLLFPPVEINYLVWPML